jgi:hypothetical protein
MKYESLLRTSNLRDTSAEWEAVFNAWPKTVKQRFAFIRNGVELYNALTFLGDGNPDKNTLALVMSDSAVYNRAYRNENSLRFCSQIRSEWLGNTKMEPEDLADLQIQITRWLHSHHLIINEINVRRAYSEILTLRSKYADVPVLAGRNVFHALHSDLGATREADAYRQQSGTYESIRASRSDDPKYQDHETYEADMQRLKQAILDHIETTPPPFTFVVTAHGSPDAIAIDGGKNSATEVLDEKSKTKATHYLRPDELAAAWNRRLKKFPPDLSKPEMCDIAVFSQCYGNDFARRFYAALGHVAGSPIIITSSEQ